ncbi:MAG: LPS export ABC transporter periplasmic protein LptC [Bacteroidetes bacterium]|nr:LPS export ABC transporter periplasmic protein LptC [Bacteroidota bacterium]
MKSFLRAILLFLPVISLMACENDIEKVKLLGTRDQSPVQSSKNIKIIYSDSAKVKVEMTAPVMNHYVVENPYLEMPKGLKANFYDESLNVKSRLTADYGIRYEKEQRMEARKNVVVVNEKGEQLNTEHLIWDEKKEKLLSDEFVKITRKDEIIYGTGFEANEDFTKYKIFNIKGTISVNKEKND